MRPKCLCDVRGDIRCDAEHCELAGPPGNGCSSKCVVCWQFLYSAAHRKIWGEDSPALPLPDYLKIQPPANKAPRTETGIVVTAGSPQSAPKTSRASQPTIHGPPSVAHGPSIAPGAIRLGDRIEAALAAAGITKDRVSHFIGAPCGCAERQRKLNALSDWAEQAVKQTKDRARLLFKRLVGG